MNRFLQSVKGASVAFGVSIMLTLSSAPASAQDTGFYGIRSPNALDSFDIVLRIVNRDTFDLLSVRFDLGDTQALGGGSLLFGGLVGTPLLVGVDSAALVTPADPTRFGFTFTGFNTGDDFGFKWDPDIATNVNYGAVVGELEGTRVLFETTGGNVDGVLHVQNGILQAAVPSPIPEPEIYAMLAAGLGLMGFVARRRKQQLAAA